MFSSKRQLPSFGELFLQRLNELEQEARECGLNMTAICREAEISRASPDRWRKKLPKTIQVLMEMERIVEERRLELERLAEERLQQELELEKQSKRTAKQRESA